MRLLRCHAAEGLAVAGEGGLCESPLGIDPTPGWDVPGNDVKGQSISLDGLVGITLSDRVKFVESVDSRSAGHTVPVVAASFSPAVDPCLAYRR